MKRGSLFIGPPPKLHVDLQSPTAPPHQAEYLLLTMTLTSAFKRTKRVSPYLRVSEPVDRAMPNLFRDEPAYAHVRNMQTKIPTTRPSISLVEGRFRTYIQKEAQAAFILLCHHDVTSSILPLIKMGASAATNDDSS